VGAEGNDTLLGGSGNDRLIGISLSSGLGRREKDVLTGGIGNDTFVLGNQASFFYDFSEHQLFDN
jgi:Ca2+-binding RTX toxin-like protein